MFNILYLALALGVALQSQTCHAAPIVVNAAHNTSQLHISADNTLNATNTTGPDPPSNITASGVGNSQNLQLAFINNLGSKDLNAYITGLDSNNQLVILQPNGEWYYPSSNGSSKTPQKVAADIAVPLATSNSSSQAARTTSLTLPGYMSGGRVWFASGTLDFFTVQGDNGITLVEPSAADPSDPSAGIDWGFVELTSDAAVGVTADITSVDFVGLPLGITLETANTNGTQSALGLRSAAVEHICDDLRAQADKDGQPWDQLCMTDSNTSSLLRVLSPRNYISLNNSAFDGYFDDYVDQIWQHYSNNTLTAGSNTAAGPVKCTVVGDQLTCEGDNRAYSRPTASDIFGCNSGPFAIEDSDNEVHQAIVPWLCAAFNRHTLLPDGGSIPSGDETGVYTQSPNNWYSSIVHKHEIASKGYAFAYDDVVPASGKNLAGLVSAPDPVQLTVTVGGPSARQPPQPSKRRV